MIKRFTQPFRPWFVCSLLGIGWLGPAVAQNGEDVDDDQPPPETEIVCFAAKKQWVCAPADDKEKAHQKAMKLAEQPDQAESFNDGQVAIQTMPTGHDFADQVQEVDPNSLQAQIQDFIPREETNTAVAKPEINPAPVETTADESAEVETVRAEPEPVVTIAQTDTHQAINRDAMVADQASESQPTASRADRNVSEVANDFRVWQRNHPEQWAFQVVGTSNRHHIDDFVRTSGIESMPHAVVRTQVNGADWWVVLVGLFDSREQALNQRHTLPATLASIAWVRQIQTIVGQAD